MLDTKICLFILRNRPRRVKERFLQRSVDEIALSSLVVNHLNYELWRVKASRELETAADEFLHHLTVVEFDLRTQQRFKVLGQKIQSHAENNKIAAHALFLKVIFVTDRPADFLALQQLQPSFEIENWLTP